MLNVKLIYILNVQNESIYIMKKMFENSQSSVLFIDISVMCIEKIFNIKIIKFFPYISKLFTTVISYLQR